MVRLTSLKDLVGEIGNIVTLKYSGSVTWTAGETITGATSGATGFIDQINSESKTLFIIPTSDEFFDAMETITSPSQATPVPILPCELTQFSVWEKSVKSFIELYTNYTFGETTSVTAEITTELRERYFNIPHGSTITSLVLNGTAQIEDSDYFYIQKTGLIDFNIKLLAAPYPKNLIITYTKGSLTIPENVKQAANILITELWKTRNHAADMRGATSLSFGEKSMNFQTPVQDKELEALLPLVSGFLKRSARFILL